VAKDHAVYEEIDAIVAPIKAANPGFSCSEVASMLPVHLRDPFWEREVGLFLDAGRAEIKEHRQKWRAGVTTVSTVLDGEPES
jgi:hypothetical protein